MLVPFIGRDGQSILQSSSVVVIGIGGLGSSALLYLASSGIGRLTLVDHDVVELSNLHRQIIHDHSCIGMKKIDSAKKRLLAMNPSLQIVTIDAKVDHDNIVEILRGHDVAVDCTDNFMARYVVSDGCWMVGIPDVFGSAVGLEGQLTVLNMKGGPCYRCLHPEPSFSDSCRSCANAGVLGPVPGMIGTLQAIETIKILLFNGRRASMNENALREAQESLLLNRQLFFNALTADCYNFRLAGPSATCLLCGASSQLKTLEQAKEWMIDAQSRLTQCAPFVVLPAGATVTPLDYFNEQLLRGAPHVLLDVRVQTQFEIASLPKYYAEIRKISIVSIETCDSADCCEELVTKLQRLESLFQEARKSAGVIRCLHIPLLELQGGEETAHQASKQLTALSKLHGMIEEIGLQYSQEEQISSVPVFVLCRRGVDSRTATALLRQLGFENVFNIEGGLSKWKEEVDPSFPMY